VPQTLATRLAFAWYVTGVFVGATLNTVTERTLAPLRSAIAGLRALRTDYAGSTFLSSAADSQPRARRT
jgi:hypothetical protein